jgi:glycosyltransferase involved in cell wall biosynthesis
MIGGIETVSGILASELTDLGCEVIVVTETPSNLPTRKRYKVLRCPDFKCLNQTVRWSDVVFHNNISLRSAWPIALQGKPWMIAHHTWIPRSGAGALAGNLKRLASRCAHNVAVSQAIAKDLGRRCTIIPNPYDDHRFKIDPHVRRDRDIVFVGRLVSDKGVDLLVKAIALLGERGVRPTVSIIGSGDEGPRLRTLVAELRLDDQIKFLGQVIDHSLVRELNRHRLMVIPSMWEEPFGIVALEGIACGCVPVAARSGGLVDAVGECGVLFKKGDASDLSSKLQSLLGSQEKIAQFREKSASHLLQHTKSSVGRAYLRALNETLRR